MKPLSAQEVIAMIAIITAAYFAGFHIGKRTEREDAAERSRSESQGG